MALHRPVGRVGANCLFTCPQSLEETAPGAPSQPPCQRPSFSSVGSPLHTLATPPSPTERPLLLWLVPPTSILPLLQSQAHCPYKKIAPTEEVTNAIRFEAIDQNGYEAASDEGQFRHASGGNDPFWTV